MVFTHIFVDDLGGIGVIELSNYREYLINKYKIEVSKYPSFIKDILLFRNKKKTYRSMVYYKIGKKKYCIGLLDINIRTLFHLITTLIDKYDNVNHESVMFYTEKLDNYYTMKLQLSSYTLNNQLSKSANLYITKYEYRTDKMKTDLHTELQISVVKKGIKGPVVSVRMQDYARDIYYSNTIIYKGWFDELSFEDEDDIFKRNDIKEIFSIVYLELIRKLLED